jgi:hypothetical protein
VSAQCPAPDAIVAIHYANTMHEERVEPVVAIAAFYSPDQDRPLFFSGARPDVISQQFMTGQRRLHDH